MNEAEKKPGNTPKDSSLPPPIGEDVRDSPAHSRAAPRVPAQLLPAPPGLTSRDPELTALDDVWASRATHQPVVVLSGIGGVGKSAVALHWLHRTRDAFPDGQLYADLDGSNPQGPAQPDEVLHGFLGTLGLEADNIPSGLAQRAAAFRSLTADRAMAMLLDDAASAAQVRPLLPAGSSVVVVVTSRWRLTSLASDSARFLEVHPLDPTESHQLLMERLGTTRVAAEPDAAAAIVETCAGLPLALSMVSARLQTRPRRTLAEEARTYRRHIRGGQRASGAGLSLQAVFDVSYEGLTPRAATVYRLCGLHPGPRLGIDALAHVLSSPRDDIEDDVDQLVESNLVTEADDGRYRQHDLLRQDSRRRAEREVTVPDRLSILRRFADWYLDNAIAADDAIHPQRPKLPHRQHTPGVTYRAFADRRAAEQWWKMEFPAVRVVFNEAREQCWDDLVWQFCEASWGFFLHHRDYQPWIVMNKAGISAAQRCGEQLAEARLRSQLGFAYAKLHRFDEAVAENVVALRLGELEGHDPTRATALAQLGRAARGQGDLAGALDFYRQAADLQARLGITRGVALCRRRSGEVLADLGRYDEAITELTGAAAAMADVGDVNQHARAVMMLATVHGRIGRVDHAVTLLLEALEVVRSLHSPYYTAEVLRNLGQLEQQRGHHVVARRYLAEARIFYTSVGDPRAADIDMLTDETTPSPAPAAGDHATGPMS
jgi:tetratricopeptide (TPR) repeat protein